MIKYKQRKEQTNFFKKQEYGEKLTIIDAFSNSSSLESLLSCSISLLSALFSLFS